MAVYGVAEAKNNFTHLLERVEEGETIIITRHGKPVAEIVRKVDDQPRPTVDMEAVLERLRLMRESLPSAHMPAADFIRQLRDEGL